MFEKINIEDLFLAQINVEYPEKDYTGPVEGIVLDDSCGYRYITVLKKEGNKYIDLNEPKLSITKADPTQNSYTIEFIDPLSNYYNKKRIFTRREAISIAKTFINFFDRKCDLVNNDNLMNFSEKTLEENFYSYNETIKSIINRINNNIKVCDEGITKYDNKSDLYFDLEFLEAIPVIRDIPSFTVLAGIVGFISVKKGIPLYGYPIEAIACAAMSELLIRYEVFGASFFERVFWPLSLHYSEKAYLLKGYKEYLLRIKDKIDDFQKELDETKNAIVPSINSIEEKLLNLEIECISIPEKLNEKKLLKERAKKKN